MISGEIYALWPPEVPKSVKEQYSGSKINTFGPPFPVNARTVTFSNVFTPSLYFYNMTCYYRGCGANRDSLCQWNGPSYWIGINLNSEPPKDDLNLSITKPTITPSEPTADGSISVSPDKALRVDVPVRGSNFDANENRSTTVNLKVGSQTLQKTISLQQLKASGGNLIIPFDITLTSDDAGSLNLMASVNPANNPVEKNIADNTIQQKIYVLCNVEDKGVTVPYFAQGGPNPWANDNYANQAPQKMKALGCYTTSFAMLLQAYKISKSTIGADINPGSVNDGLNSIGLFSELGPNYSAYSGYTASGAVQAGGAVNFARASYAKNCIAAGGKASACKTKAKGKISYIGKSDEFNEESIKTVYKELCKGNPVILKVPSISNPNDKSKSHFVLATGMGVDKDNGQQLITNDPAIRKGFRYNTSKIKGYRLYKQISDPSMIFFHLTGGSNMMISDPKGYRSGYDPMNKQTLNGIPSGSYTLPESIGSALEGDNTVTPLEANFEVLEALDGAYQVQVYADPNKTITNYRLTAYSYDASGAINQIFDRSGRIQGNQSAVLNLNHSIQALPIRYAGLQINKALFFDQARKDKALLTGRINLEDGRSIYKIDKFITIKLGTFVKSIPVKKLYKTKIFGRTHYIYVDWARSGITLDLNVDTGNFILYVDNYHLDGNKSSLTTSLDIQVDDIYAESLVTFKGIKGRSCNGK
ncbi:MAG: C39 family peptidase [Pseudobdellovibrionaceae bacterium]